MIKRHLSNLFGPSTKRKLLAFFVDDYGAIATESKKAYSEIAKNGISNINSRFIKNDCLENNQDMEILFNVLHSFSDIYNKPVAWTPLSLVANPDFYKIRNENFDNYYYEELPDSYNRIEGCDRVLSYIREGIKNNFYVPQFHGREHFNTRFYIETLKNNISDAIIPFNNNSVCVFRKNGYSLNTAFRIIDSDNLNDCNNIISDGISLFQKTFGYKPIHFNAPGMRETLDLHKRLSLEGIKYIETDKIAYHDTSRRVKLRWNGMQNHLGQRYWIRNCFFEPASYLNGDWADYTFKQIEIAFKWKKPAVISSHRVNFVGGISEKNREVGIASLEKLLRMVCSKYSDIEFVNSKELFNLMFK